MENINTADKSAVVCGKPCKNTILRHLFWIHQGDVNWGRQALNICTFIPTLVLDKPGNVNKAKTWNVNLKKNQQMWNLIFFGKAHGGC